MRECEIIDEMYVDVSDKHAAPEDQKRFHDHLERCDHCREDFRYYALTVNALSSLEPIDPPANVLPQISERIEEASTPFFVRHFRNLFSKPFHIPIPASAAALVVLVVASLFLYQNGYVVDMLPFTAPLSAHETTSERAAVSANLSQETGSLLSGQPDRVSRHLATVPAHSATGLTGKSMRASTARENTTPFTAPQFTTVAERLGADNLTVESDSIENAVASLKRILPNLEGKLVLEKSRATRGERVLKVMIPSHAYGNLTTELINHGAVASGAGKDIHPPKRAEKNQDKVLLYIRFTPTQ